MNKIEIGVNNNGTIQLLQDAKDKKISFKRFDNKMKIESEANIPLGDIVMLLNYYNFVKRNNIQCDFINPNGGNEK